MTTRTARCRAQIASDCEGTVGDAESPADEYGTFDGESVVCMSCYCALMPLTPSGRALTHEIEPAIARARAQAAPVPSGFETAREGLARILGKPDEERVNVRVFLSEDTDFMHAATAQTRFRLVWEGLVLLAEPTTDERLAEDVFRSCQNLDEGHQAPYQGRSLSVGDAVQIGRGGEWSTWLVEPVGFTEVSWPPLTN